MTSLAGAYAEVGPYTLPASPVPSPMKTAAWLIGRIAARYNWMTAVTVTRPIGRFPSPSSPAGGTVQKVGGSIARSVSVLTVTWQWATLEGRS